MIVIILALETAPEHEVSGHLRDYRLKTKLNEVVGTYYYILFIYQYDISAICFR